MLFHPFAFFSEKYGLKVILQLIWGRSIYGLLGKGWQEIFNVFIVLLEINNLCWYYY